MDINLYSDIKWLVDYDLEQVNDCENGRCDEICRCGTIEHVTINGLSPTLSFATHLVGKQDLTLLYCVDRLLTHTKELRTEAGYDVEIGPGYYGQELESIKLLPEIIKKLETSIEFLKQSDNTARIEYCLALENGAILPTHKNLNWSIKRIKLGRIELPKQFHAKLLDKRIIADYTCGECRKFIPQALVLATSNGFKVIDGYHRITAAQNNAKGPSDTILTLVGEIAHGNG